MPRNHYVVLGIGSGAGPEEIKSAYRRRAKEFHPDRSGREPGPFLDVQEAYSVLRDPRRRSEYDRRLARAESRRRAGPEPEPLRPAGSETDLPDISLVRSFSTVRPSFDELIERLFRNFSGAAAPKAERVRELTAEVILTPKEARRGGQARILVPASATCPACEGRGGVGPWVCWRCSGEGHFSGEVPITFAFPSGIENEHVVGVPLERLGIGNLYLTVRFRVSAEA